MNASRGPTAQDLHDYTNHARGVRTSAGVVHAVGPRRRKFTDSTIGRTPIPVPAGERHPQGEDSIRHAFMTAATTASAVLRPADPTSGQGARRLVTALFDDDAGAERAFRVCVERGYEIGEINVVMSEDTRRRLLAEGSQVADDMATRKAEGGELGGPSGGRAAILVTILAAVSAALAVPTLGLAMAGPTAAALLGAGAAGLAAGLMGALGDWGLPDERVRQYEAGIRDGAILIGVEPHSEDDARTIEREWKALGGRSVHR